MLLPGTNLSVHYLVEVVVSAPGAVLFFQDVPALLKAVSDAAVAWAVEHCAVPVEAAVAFPVACWVVPAGAAADRPV